MLPTVAEPRMPWPDDTIIKQPRRLWNTISDQEYSAKLTGDLRPDFLFFLFCIQEVIFFLLFCF